MVINYSDIMILETFVQKRLHDVTMKLYNGCSLSEVHTYIAEIYWHDPFGTAEFVLYRKNKSIVSLVWRVRILTYLKRVFTALSVKHCIGLQMTKYQTLPFLRLQLYSYLAHSINIILL